MIEKIGHVKNPLSVIAMFAAIAEISGAVVLPFIEPANQIIYIWFLILFPTFLVSIFFLTLNMNHRVLYSPSDYKDENNFMSYIKKATPEEQIKKTLEETEEIESDDQYEQVDVDNDTAQNNVDTGTNPSHKNIEKNGEHKHRLLMSEVTLAEKLAVNKLSKELGIDFKTDVKFESTELGRGAVFDAIGINEKEVHAVEIKLFKSKNISPTRLARVFEQSEHLAHSFKGFDKKDLILHIFIVVDNNNINKPHLKEKFSAFATKFKIKSNIYITTLDDLQNEYQYS